VRRVVGWKENAVLMKRGGVLVLVGLLAGCGLTVSQSDSKGATTRKTSAKGVQPAKSVWKKLTADEARVVEACGTERPFSGKFVKHKAKGTYTCTRCGAPLFPSTAKFKSGTG
jgi:peptide-methionine (R)-S-oxide reductase